MDMTCEETRAQAGAYALGALSPAERTALEAHARACPACARYLASFAPVKTALLNTAPAQKPPPELRAALLQRIRPAPAKPSWAMRLQTAFFSPRRAVAFGLMALVLIAAVIALAAPIRQNAQAAQARQTAQQLAANPAAASLPMYPRAAAPQASGALRFIKDQTTGVLEAKDLPALPADRAYQLWLVNPDGTRDSGALFKVTNAEEWIVVTGAKPLGQYANFGITVEPSTGSPGPTGPGALNSRQS
jgi:anti-sigma-K factor RskA